MVGGGFMKTMPNILNRSSGPQDTRVLDLLELPVLLRKEKNLLSIFLLGDYVL